MAISTQPIPASAHVAELASRYVDVASLPWTPTRFPGIDMKVLFEDPSGMMTALFRFAPGTILPLHEHVEIEQTFVLEGCLEDDEGIATAGNFVWRPRGSRHIARSPTGALLIGFFLKPNRFFDESRTENPTPARPPDAWQL